ncbi:hypothetical protein TNCV_507631 [Trichonephila clavipes]|nr:hypothetical protein TNCV_507631 [Trichonephila clavipes]
MELKSRSFTSKEPQVASDPWSSSMLCAYGADIPSLFHETLLNLLSSCLHMRVYYGGIWGTIWFRIPFDLLCVCLESLLHQLATHNSSNLVLFFLQFTSRRNQSIFLRCHGIWLEHFQELQRNRAVIW